MIGRGSLAPEHKSKMFAARDAYWAKRKAEKAAKILEEGAPIEPSALIANSDNGPAKIQPITPLGRPATVASNLSPRERTQLRVNKKLEKLLDAQIDLATGLYYVTADGKHVYRKNPDGARGEYLLNQLIGKPKESIEVKTVTLKLDL